MQGPHALADVQTMQYHIYNLMTTIASHLWNGEFQRRQAMPPAPIKAPTKRKQGQLQGRQQKRHCSNTHNTEDAHDDEGAHTEDAQTSTEEKVCFHHFKKFDGELTCVANLDILW